MTRYRIMANGNTIYDTQDKNTYPVVKPQLHQELNNAGTLSFTVIPGHPYYNNITKMQTFVTVYKNNDEIFYGRVLRTEKGLDGQLNVDCEGGITFFLDSEMGKVEVTETVEAFFTRCINNHNSQVEAAKRFTIGTISVAKKNESHAFKITDWEDTKSTIESNLLGQFGGFLNVRPKNGGGHYIDYVENFGRINTQPIQIGVNIIDKDDSVSGENIFTILHPLGKTSSSGAGQDTDVTLSGLSQSDISLQNVTLVGQNLELTDKISLYGRITRTERFPNAEKAIDLLHKAEEFITRMGTQLPATCDINLVNFNLLNPEIMDIFIGDTFNNIEGFSGQTLTVGEIDTDLENPSNDKIVLKNEEEINSDRFDPESSSSKGLSDKVSKNKQQEAFRYKYIREEEDKLILFAKNTEINASEKFSALSNKIFLTAEENEAGEPGELVLRAVKNIDDPYGSSLVMTVNGISLNTITDKTTVDGVEEIKGTSIYQHRDHIDAVAGKWSLDLQGNVHVIDGSNLYLGEGNASLAVYTDGNLTGGILVDKLNDNSTVTKIIGDRVDISATQLVRTGIFNDDYLTAGMLVQKINGNATEKVKLGFYDEESLTAGVLVQKINGDANQKASLGFYDSETLTAGVMVEKINGDANQKASLGFYDNNSLTAGVLVEKINGDRTQRASLGFYDDGNLTTGIIIDKINGTSGSVKVLASKVDLGNYATVDQLRASEAEIGKLTTGVTKAHLLRADTIQVDTFSMDGDNGVWRTISLGSVKSMTVLAHSIENKDFDHSHGITATADSNGRVTITLGMAQATAGTANFNIADTEFYRNAMANIRVSNVSVNLTGTPYDDGVYGYMMQTATIGYSVNGVSKSEPNVNVNVTSAYEAGRVFGQDRMGVVINGSSIKCDVSGTKKYDITVDVDQKYNSNLKKFTALAVVYANGNAIATDTQLSGPDAYNDGKAAGYEEGFNAVTIPSANVTEYQNAVYNSTTHNTTVYIRAEASNEKYRQKTFTVSGANAYNAGKASVNISSVAKNGQTTFSSNHKTVYIPVTATASNGETKDASISSDISEAVDSVTISSLAKDGTTTFSSNYKTVYIPTTATASNGKTKTVNISSDITTAFNAGADSVTISSLAKDGTTTYSANYKTVYIPTTATASNGKTKSASISSSITDAYNYAETAGKNAVTINKSSWSNGVCTFTKSTGTASTKTVSLAQDSTTTWRSGNYANIADVKVLDDSSETGLTISINAVSRYNAGYNECLGNMDSININSNGSYYPADYNCTGFSYIYVNVPTPSSSVEIGDVYASSSSSAAVGKSVRVYYRVNGGSWQVTNYKTVQSPGE